MANFVGRLRGGVGLLASGVLALLAGGAVRGASVGNFAGLGVSNIFVILMENHDWSTIYRSPNCPFLNNVLLPQASFATRYYNPPGLHPSLPNYLWLVAGTNFGIFDDQWPDVNTLDTTNHLAWLLDRAGISDSALALRQRRRLYQCHRLRPQFDPPDGSRHPRPASLAGQRRRRAGLERLVPAGATVRGRGPDAQRLPAHRHQRVPGPHQLPAGQPPVGRPDLEHRGHERRHEWAADFAGRDGGHRSRSLLPDRPAALKPKGLTRAVS